MGKPLFYLDYDYELLIMDSVKIYNNQYINRYKEIICQYLPSIPIISDTDYMTINDIDIKIPEEYKSELIPIISSIIH